MIFYIEVVASENSQLSHDEARMFNIRQNVLALLFGRFLDEIKGVEKINISFSDNIEKPVISGPVQYFPFILVDWPFDFQEYLALSKYERRSYVAKILHEALQAICTELNYDCQPFQQAYEKVKELDYQNTYIHGKLKASPDRQHKAGIHIRVEEEYAEISALVQDNEGNETSNIPLIRTLPHYMFIYKFIHSTKWLDKRHFQVCDKSGQVVFGVDVPEEKLSMQLLPKTMGLPELLNEVKLALAEG